MLRSNEQLLCTKLIVVKGTEYTEKMYQLHNSIGPDHNLFHGNEKLSAGFISPHMYLCLHV